MQLKDVYLASQLEKGAQCVEIRDSDDSTRTTDEAHAEPAAAVRFNPLFQQLLRFSLPRLDLLLNEAAGELRWSGISWRLEEFRGCAARDRTVATRMLPSVSLVDEARQATHLMHALVAVCAESDLAFEAPAYVVEDLALTIMEPGETIASALPLRFLIAPSNAVPGGNVPLDKTPLASPRSADVADRYRAKWLSDAYKTAMGMVRGAAMAATPVTVFTVSHPYSTDDLHKFQLLSAALEKESENDSGASRTARRTLVFVHMYTKAQLAEGSVDWYVRRLGDQLNATHKAPSRCVYWVSADSLTEIRHQWCPSYHINDWSRNQEDDVHNLRSTLTQATGTDANEVLKVVLEQLRIRINAPALVLEPHPSFPPRVATADPLVAPERAAMYLIRPCKEREAGAGGAHKSFEPVESVGMLRQSTHAEFEMEAGWLEVAERSAPKGAGGTDVMLPVVGVRFPSATAEFIEHFKQTVADNVTVDEVSDTNQSLAVTVRLTGAARVNLDGSISIPVDQTSKPQRLHSRYVRGPAKVTFSEVEYHGGAFIFYIRGLDISDNVDV